jgi:hypothetical protein
MSKKISRAGLALAALLLLLAPGMSAAKKARPDEVPPYAKPVIAAVRAAAKARDLAKLRPLMADFFIHSFGDVYTPDAAIAWWKEHPAELDTLVRKLDKGCGTPPDGCRSVEKGDPLTDDGCVRCPARAPKGALCAGFEDMGGEDWKLVYFVGGD